MNALLYRQQPLYQGIILTSVLGCLVPYVLLIEECQVSPIVAKQSLCFFLISLSGKLSDMKSTWSPGPISHPSQVSLSHELWKVPQGPRSNTAAPTRPPPGLTNPTKHSSTWGGNSLGLAQGWSSSYTSGEMPQYNSSA